MKKWKCPICDHLNPEEEDTCQECGALREESSYDAIADEEDWMSGNMRGSAVYRNQDASNALERSPTK